ncbi:MAG: zinc ribbon domain-containing protein [Desulfohalobiaceae bacterium]
MPIYEYSCPECQHLFEEWQKDFRERTIQCPICGAEAKRMISNTAFILKGSGWYVTDYCRGSAASSAGNDNGNGQAGDKQEKSQDNAQAKPAEGNSESPAESKSSSTQE